MDRQVDDGKAGEKYRSFGLTQSLPNHHRNEMARHRGKRGGAGSHGDDQRPENWRAQCLAGGHVRGAVRRGMACTHGELFGFDVAVGRQSHALRRAPDEKRQR